MLLVISLYREVLHTDRKFADAWLNLASSYHSLFSGTGTAAEAAIVQARRVIPPPPVV
jgi:hypothetical protein